MKIRRRFKQTKPNALETKQNSFLQGRSKQTFYERLAKTK
jgi:hypothetical protein